MIPLQRETAIVTSKKGWKKGLPGPVIMSSAPQPAAHDLTIVADVVDAPAENFVLRDVPCGEGEKEVAVMAVQSEALTSSREEFAASRIGYS